MVESRLGVNSTHRVLTALLVLGRFHPYLCCERKSNEREKMKKLRGYSLELVSYIH